MWKLDPIDESFRQEVCEYCRSLCISNNAMAFDRDAFTEEHERVAHRVKRDLVWRGWWGVGIPAEYGGATLSPVRIALLRRELLYHHVPNDRYPQSRDAGLSLVAPALLRYGTEDQRREHLPKLARGEWTYWQTMTEPDAGSDLGNIQTRAVLDDDVFVVTGSKVFIGEQNKVDWLYTTVRTASRERKQEGITVLLIDATSPGITVTPLTPIAGNEKQSIFFSEVRVPVANAVGPADGGWAVVRSTLDIEHGGSGGGGGEYECILDEIIDAWRDDSQVPEGKMLAVAELFVRMRTEKLLGARNLMSVISGRRLTYEGPQLHLHQKLFHHELAERLVELVGLRGLEKRGSVGAIFNGELEHIYRASLATHPGGTPEMQKRAIAHALDLPKD